MDKLGKNNWPHKAAYQKAYNHRPEQIKKRAMRNHARREYERLFGDLPSTTDVDHKKMLKVGGTNDQSNLRAVDRHENRGWRQGLRKTPNSTGY
jgi:hypothetical protein